MKRRVRAFSHRVRWLMNQGQVEICKKPWPHIIIKNFFPGRVANIIKEDFLYGISQPSKNYEANFGIEIQFNNRACDAFYMSRVLKQFFYYDWIDINDFCAQHIGNGDREDTNYFRAQRFITSSTYPMEANEIIRDWHVDAEKKIYHIMAYFGDCKSGGEYELKNDDGEEKTIPFTHNSLIIWKNTTNSWHRYRAATDHLRQTISIPLETF